LGIGVDVSAWVEMSVDRDVAVKMGTDVGVAKEAEFDPHADRRSENNRIHDP